MRNPPVLIVSDEDTPVDGFHNAARRSWFLRHLVKPLSQGGNTRDQIFAFASSLKSVFLKCIPLIVGQPSIFKPHIQQDVRDKLVKSAQISNGTLTAYQNFFSYYRPLDSELVNLTIPQTRGTNLATLGPLQCYVQKPQISDSIEDGYALIITQLCLILSFLLRVLRVPSFYSFLTNHSLRAVSDTAARLWTHQYLVGGISILTAR